jgi:putative addiction module component (TIGR02574 family)
MIRRWRMSVTATQLEQQARALSPEERARLVEMLLESLHDTQVAEIEAEWNREIADRIAAYERGEAQTFAAEEVFAEARQLAR